MKINDGDIKEMAEFIYTTSKEIRGPWFIDSDKLEDLDKILDEEWARLTVRSEARLNEEIEDRLKSDLSVELAQVRKKYLEEEEITQKRREEIKAQLKAYSYREERSIIIYLKKNKKIPVNSFSNALREPILLEEVPIGFDVVLKSGDIQGKIKLSKAGSLEITASPENVTESKEFFAALQRWSSTCRPPRWQQLWSIINPFQWLLWLLIVWVSLFFITDSKTAAKNLYKEQARQLLKNGINQDTQLKAIEVMLAIEADYIPQDTGQTSFFPWVV